MANDIIKFSYNWNNKLNNKAFTTIRRHNPQKYRIGNQFIIELNGEKKGAAILQEKRVFKIDQLNEFMSFIDTGYNRDKTTEILNRMYKGIDLKNTFFDLCLLVYVGREKTKEKEIQQKLELVI